MKLSWADLSHHDKYSQLARNRENYCKSGSVYKDNPDKTVSLDGQYIQGLATLIEPFLLASIFLSS